jgi:hypothetical protein
MKKSMYIVALIASIFLMASCEESKIEKESGTTNKKLTFDEIDELSKRKAKEAKEGKTVPNKKLSFDEIDELSKQKAKEAETK